ncbi:C40 family peptidase [Aldersonia kunmingensis]|uniref:C40 family peptidase n=1 Tax=Aldersonia kunmingensis TaxID=408066 RepID=UPI003CCBD797
MRKILTTAAVIAATVILPAAPALAQSTGSGGSGSGGSSGSGSAGSSDGFALPVPSPAGLGALAAATTQTGKPYLWGGTGPNAWDCSGLVQWAFRQVGVSLPRTTWEQAEVGQKVPLWALMPGDVIILNRDASHVGIYTGFGQVFNAYGRGVPVGLTPLSNFEINTIRRF